MVTVVISAVAVAIEAVNLAVFKRRPVWRAGANAFSGALGATAAAAAHLWWFVGVWLVLVLWGLAGLAAIANRKQPEGRQQDGDRP
jgi:hypothetical protein